MQIVETWRFKIICAQESRVHSEDPRNIDPPATAISISYVSPHHFSTLNFLLKVLTWFYLVAKNVFLHLGILLLMHWFYINIITYQCKSKVILITGYVLVLYHVRNMKFSKLNLPMYAKTLPYKYRHIWLSFVLPSWSWQGNAVVKAILF